MKHVLVTFERGFRGSISEDTDTSCLGEWHGVKPIRIERW